MRSLNRAYKYTRESDTLITLTHVSPEVAKTLKLKTATGKEQNFLFGYIINDCVEVSWGNTLDYVDKEGNRYLDLCALSGPGEDFEITNFLTDEDMDGRDPETLKKVSQQKVIFK